VVLVRPRGADNVGAACRAIKNMGAGALVIVGSDVDAAAAARMAVHARDVLDERVEVPRLADAVRGCSVVFGTTARGGPYRERSRDIRELMQSAVASTLSAGPGASAPVAVVFGPEDTGLTNDDIAVCHHLAFIPTSDAYASLNLAQAVVVALYEFRRALLSHDETRIAQPASRAHADAGEVEAMFEQLELALLDIGFLLQENPGHVMATLRGLLSRAGLDPREVAVLRGLARQIGWFADGGHEVVAAKRQRGGKLR
jgi:tRNA/rRNA methyltransferase